MDIIHKFKNKPFFLLIMAEVNVHIQNQGESEQNDILKAAIKEAKKSVFEDLRKVMCFDEFTDSYVSFTLPRKKWEELRKKHLGADIERDKIEEIRKF